jgi:4-amino-4-deoxy-L-arabinose transferase-like glycosyltransferase
MFSWLVSIFMFAGFEALASARIVIALCGGALVCGCWMLSRRFYLSPTMRFIAMLIGALLVSDWTIRFVTADVLIAAFIVYYLYLVSDPDILGKYKKVLAVGAVGGVAFFAKNYMLPFFMLHFPVTILVRFFFREREARPPLQRLIASYVIGVAIFLAISSLWMAVLSAKYGEFTITGKGKIAYALMGPEEVRHPPLFMDGLHKTKNDYAIHVFEDHSELKYTEWSPFESWEYFMHQVSLIQKNLAYMLNHFVNESPFFTYAFIIGVLTLVPIALLITDSVSERKFLFSWFVLTFAIYSSGYILLIARSPRRFYALMIMFLFLSFYVIQELLKKLAEVIPESRKKILIFYFVTIVLFAFSLKPGVHLLKSSINIFTQDQVNTYREIAEQVNTAEFSQPYAIVRSAQKAYTDYYIAFYLGKQFLGRPLSNDVEGITQELQEVDARTLVVFENLDTVELLKGDRRYLHVDKVVLKEDKRYWNAVNTKQDMIKAWDREVNIFATVF